MRHYVIGDVHGCIDELIELETILEKDSDDCFFIFTGDIIDRGRNSATVVAHILELQKKGKAACVLGNHDEMLLQVYAANTGRAIPNINIYKLDGHQLRALQQHWYMLGGRETLQSYDCDLKSMENIPDAHIDFLSTLPLLWHDDAIIVTHALASKTSILSTMSAPDRIPDDAYVRQSLLWDRSLPDTRVDPDRLHISGHTPIQNVHINVELGCIMLDTGCVYGNTLSAYCRESSEVFSVVCKSMG